MILRPGWLPRRIRNASGNGGGVLLGYMPMVSLSLTSTHSKTKHTHWRIVDPSDLSTWSSAETEEFAHFK
jgi:hypothetical protein